ncbi:hypothetical protein ACFVQ3_12165 [Oerskovia sp. NPDC057915]|uniref:hypothetical protein n=1 Tax=Oerskovia sp. NPDC057915 TaxID=3346280 RepID=UPI0036D91B7E
MSDRVRPPLPVQVRRPAWGTWGRRRLVVVALLAPGLLALLVEAGGGWTHDVAPLWLVLLVVVAVVGGLTLASYVPARGEPWRDTLGCSPCAVVSGGTVLAAVLLVSQAPHQVGMVLPALAVVLFGLVQRTSSTRDACARGEEESWSSTRTR